MKHLLLLLLLLPARSFAGSAEAHPPGPDPPVGHDPLATSNAHVEDLPTLQETANPLKINMKHDKAADPAVSSSPLISGRDGACSPQQLLLHQQPLLHRALSPLLRAVPPSLACHVPPLLLKAAVLYGYAGAAALWSVLLVRRLRPGAARAAAALPVVVGGVGSGVGVGLEWWR